MTWLTEDEIHQIEQGERIEVIWSGGNGPHEYVMHWEGGMPFADQVPESRMKVPKTYNPLRFLGTQRFHTRVRRVSG